MAVLVNGSDSYTLLGTLPASAIRRIRAIPATWARSSSLRGVNLRPGKVSSLDFRCAVMRSTVKLSFVTRTRRAPRPMRSMGIGLPASSRSCMSSAGPSGKSTTSSCSSTVCFERNATWMSRPSRCAVRIGPTEGLSKIVERFLAVLAAYLLQRHDVGVQPLDHVGEQIELPLVSLFDFFYRIRFGTK